MKKMNDYVGKSYPLVMGINGRPFEYKGVVIESYGNLCLVEEQRAYVQGKYNQYGIYRLIKDNDGKESLNPLLIDYSKDFAEIKYSAPLPVVKAEFDRRVTTLKTLEEHAQSVASAKAEVKKLSLPGNWLKKLLI